MPASEYYQWVEILEGKNRSPDTTEQMLAQLLALTTNINSKIKVEPIDFIINLDESIKKSIKYNRMSEELMKDLDKI